MLSFLPDMSAMTSTMLTITTSPAFALFWHFSSQCFAAAASTLFIRHPEARTHARKHKRERKRVRESVGVRSCLYSGLSCEIPVQCSAVQWYPYLVVRTDKAVSKPKSNVVFVVVFIFPFPFLLLFLSFRHTHTRVQVGGWLDVDYCVDASCASLRVNPRPEKDMNVSEVGLHVNAAGPSLLLPLRRSRVVSCVIGCLRAPDFCRLSPSLLSFLFFLFSPSLSVLLMQETLEKGGRKETRGPTK